MHTIQDDVRGHNASSQPARPSLRPRYQFNINSGEHSQRLRTHAQVRFDLFRGQIARERRSLRDDAGRSESAQGSGLSAQCPFKAAFLAFELPSFAASVGSEQNRRPLSSHQRHQPAMVDHSPAPRNSDKTSTTSILDRLGDQAVNTE